MKFRIQNLTGANVLKMKGLASRDLSAEEMQAEAGAVIVAMQPHATFYRAGLDGRGQSVSVPTRQAVAQNVKVFVKEDDKPEEELSAKDLQELFGEKIAAYKAAKLAAKKARAEKRAGR